LQELTKNGDAEAVETISRATALCLAIVFKGKG
jgi:hypothetical protein